MSLWHIDFRELYARHLCRHGQLGINVVHLGALFAVWFGVYGFLHWLTQAAWVPVALAGAYLAVIALGAPPRVVAATAAFLTLFLAAVLTLTGWPFWVYLLLVPVFYKVQSWSHRVWTVEEDMTDFNRKYAKGAVLFVILLFYEVPIVLNYLLFAGKGRGVDSAPVAAAETAAAPY